MALLSLTRTYLFLRFLFLVKLNMEVLVELNKERDIIFDRLLHRIWIRFPC